MYIQGLETNPFLGSKLANAYAFSGLLRESRLIFDKIVNKNQTVVSSILAGYYRAGELDEVCNVYLDLKRRKIGLHGSAFTLTLKSCSQLGGLDFGKGIHVDVLKCGLNTDRFVGSSLIKLYAMCGDMVDAGKVFDEITERDLVLYTSLITGYTQTDDQQNAYEAFEVVKRMQTENVVPNRVTLVSLLQGAAQLRLLDHGQLIHAYAIRKGIGCFDEVFETSLMDMYIKCGAPHMATVVFNQMNIKGTASWNVLISGHVKALQPVEALNLVSLMGQKGHRFDSFALANGILSCANLGLLRVGKSIHGYMLRTGLHLDVVVNTNLIDMYTKCNNCEKAREIFDSMKDKDVISCNVMIAGYRQNGHAREAIEAFHNMRKSGLTVNEATVLEVVSAFSDMKDIRQGKSIHGFVITRGFDSITDIANQVLYLYVKCDYIDYARLIFNQIKHKDLVSWTSMMKGYEDVGNANEVIKLFRKMMNLEKDLNPDSTTLTCLLQAFVQLGCLRQIKEIHCRTIRLSMENDVIIMNSLLTSYSKCGTYKTARELFGQMGQTGQMVNRCLASWNTMIAASGMHGDCYEALKLIKEMKKENIVPDEVTFMSVLSSCSHAGLVDQGLTLFKSMKEEYGLVPNEEHYGCMVDLLGRAGQFDEAFDFLKCLPPTQNGSALGALVAACRVHGNNEMGEALGRWLLDYDPENSSSYGLVSNMYAENEKWSEAACVRDAAKQRGLKTTSGFSMIQIDR
ncbi:pentatricopeptide repeat-containing protein At1g06140, mitochondrial-like [Rutidosis leptorrhynchoides]|uniref:pentatricopeptide repeat-containing protein At1g06140, mitochondrial-like n=1 Tax=Rutidosis leptorrhynchoides TaxID=125765 RepID=UPI003A99D6F8